MAGTAGGVSATRPGRQAVLAVAGAAAMILSGCSAGTSSSPSSAPGAQCTGPTAMPVQVAADPGRDQLTITAAGISGSPLRSAAPSETRDAPDGDVPVRDLPPGVHVRIADLEDGEIVRTEVLAGGMARTEALGEGEYAVGLISVDRSGRIAGLASTRVVVDDGGAVVSDPTLEQSREVPVERLEVHQGSAVAEVADQEGAPTRTQWWLEGPGRQESGQTDDGTARLGEVSDGTHTLMLLEESADAPGIAQRAASCQFGVSDGELTPPGPTDDSS